MQVKSYFWTNYLPMSKIVFSFLLCALSLNLWAQKSSDVIGVWKTIDDETGKAKSHVELYMKGDQLYGKVTKILNPAKANSICEKCDDDDDRKNKKVLNMEIIRNMEWDDDEWDDGTILDPNKGSIYDCKLWIEPETPDLLYLRGYIGFVYRTQTWHRVK